MKPDVQVVVVILVACILIGNSWRICNIWVGTLIVPRQFWHLTVCTNHCRNSLCGHGVHQGGMRGREGGSDWLGPTTGPHIMKMWSGKYARLCNKESISHG